MNTTPDSNPDHVDASQIASKVIFSLLGLVGIIGNGLVLVVMISIKELRTTTNAFIVNQSVIDMVTSILLLAQFVAPPLPFPEERSAANLVCAIWNSKYIFWALTTASTFNLVLLTLERYFAAVLPIIYRKHFNNRRTAVLATVPWMIGFLYKIYWAAVNKYSKNECKPDYPSSQVQALAGCMTFLITYFLPLVIMAFAYISIEKTLRQRLDNSGTAQNGRYFVNSSRVTNPPPNQRERVRVNVIKTLIIVSMTYGICWTPNHIAYILYNLGKPIDLDRSPLYHFTVYLAFLNMCINPFIYTLKYRQFKKGLKELFSLTHRSESSSVSLSHISG